MDFEIEVKHMILAVNVAVGSAFFGLAALTFASGRVFPAVGRLVFGALLVAAGFYLYRLRERQERFGS